MEHRLENLTTDKYLTTEETAKYVRCSPRTLEAKRQDGTGPKFVKAGRKVLYRISDLEAWMAARTFSSTSEADAALTLTQ